MSLQEDITACGDRFYDDVKWARHWTPESDPRSEEAIAHSRIGAWERVCAAAQLGERLAILNSDLIRRIADLNQENYRLKTACDGYATAIANYRRALQEAGVEIAKLKMELMTRG